MATAAQKKKEFQLVNDGNKDNSQLKIQSIKLIAADLYDKYLCFACKCVYVCELIGMSIDFDVISMTGFGHFQLICVIFG